MELLWTSLVRGRHLSAPVARMALENLREDSTAAYVLAHPDVDPAAPWVANWLTGPRLNAVLEIVHDARARQLLAAVDLPTLLAAIRGKDPAQRPHPLLLARLSERDDEPEVAWELLPYLSGPTQAAAVVTSASLAFRSDPRWAAAAVNHPFVVDQVRAELPRWGADMLTAPDPVGVFVTELTGGRRWALQMHPSSRWALHVAAASDDERVAATVLSVDRFSVPLRRFLSTDPRFASRPVGAQADRELPRADADPQRDTAGSIRRALGQCHGDEEELARLWARLQALDDAPGRRSDVGARLSAETAAQFACRAHSREVFLAAMTMASQWLAGSVDPGDASGRATVRARLAVATALAPGGSGLLPVAWPDVVAAGYGVAVATWMADQLARTWAGTPAGVDLAFTQTLAALAEDFTGTTADLLATVTAIAS